MIELRVPLGQLNDSMERQAKDRIQRGDFYTKYASEQFGVPEENVTPAMRRMTKEKAFCFVYGGSGVLHRS